MFSFKNVGHFLASSIKAIVKSGPAILTKIENEKPVIETVTAAAAIAIGGPAAGVVATTLEDLVFAVAGDVLKIYTTGDEAAQQHLQNAGLDVNIIDAIKAAIKDGVGALSAIATVAKSFEAKK